MNSPDCIFCKIIAKQIPNHTVYEDDDTLAFLDIFPHAKGHTVVIPKKHVERYSDISESDMEALFLAVQKAAIKLGEVLKPEAFNIGLNDGKVSGQAVPHVHVHILPRWQNDGGASFHAIIKNSGDKSVDDVAKLLL